MKISFLLLILLALSISAFPQSPRELWQKFAKHADIIVMAEVEEVKPAPGFWSGTIAAPQNVRFRLIKAFKGSIPSDEFELEYYVVKKDSLVDPDEPHLSTKIFKTGSRLAVFLKANSNNSDTYFKGDKHVGTLVLIQLANK
jgi:hypothetical protein